MANPNCDPNIGPGTPNFEGDEGPPDITDANMICLHGPCQYLWTTTARFDASNNSPDLLPEGVDTLKVSKRMCTRLAFDEDPDITEDRIYTCSEWDPVDLVQLAPREARRAAYRASKAGA